MQPCSQSANIQFDHLPLGATISTGPTPGWNPLFVLLSALQGSGREWCYLDPQLQQDFGSPSWGYCAPVVDYDVPWRGWWRGLKHV